MPMNIQLKNCVNKKMNRLKNIYRNILMKAYLYIHKYTIL